MGKYIFLTSSISTRQHRNHLLCRVANVARQQRAVCVGERPPAQTVFLLAQGCWQVR
uniref:Uncharacterized protein n=1 Tax=Setaria italica TaxID=4555 RepID=K3ZPD0_SETIT